MKRMHWTSMGMLCTWIAIASASVAQAGNVMSHFSSDHLVGYIQTDATVNVAAVAGQTGGVDHGSYATWTDNIASYKYSKWNVPYSVPLNFAMTDQGEMFVGVGGSDVRKALSVMTPYYWRRDNQLETTQLVDRLADVAYDNLRNSGAVSGTTIRDNSGNPTSFNVGLLNNTGSEIHSVYSFITWMHTYNSEWNSFSEPGVRYWGGDGQDGLWTGSANRYFELQYDDITDSLVYTVNHNDNGNWSRTRTDGVQRTYASSCCGSPNWWSLDHLPDNAKIEGSSSWSEVDAAFFGVFMGDGVNITHSTGPANRDPMIASYATGWNGEAYASPIPAPAAVVAAAVMLGAIHLRRRNNA